MKFLLPSLLLGSALVISGAEVDTRFVPLFNGQNLDGWVNANCAPETWTIREGVIHCTGFPTGALRTTRQYENFVLELEWRHLSSGGNSGVFLWGTAIPAPGVPFLRGIEVQVLDHGFNIQGKNEWYTTHGDVFPIHGATMKPFGRHNGMRSFPSEERSKPSPEWNHYRITCTNGVIRLEVNGKEVSGGEDCNYRKGYLALESEGAPVEFRNVRIRELPSSGTPADLTAPEDLGWQSLFSGLDLRGWRTNAATAACWNVRGERLRASSSSPRPEQVLWSDAEFGDAEFIIDCRRTRESRDATAKVPALVLRTGAPKGIEILLSGISADEHRRFQVVVRGREVTVTAGGQKVGTATLPEESPARGPIGLLPGEGDIEFMNLFARAL